MTKICFRYMLLRPLRAGQYHHITDVNRANPGSQMDGLDEIYTEWLFGLITFPPLSSKLLLVFDCYIEEIVDGSPHKKEGQKYTFLGDVEAGFALILAGYQQNSVRPGRLSTLLMSVLENLAQLMVPLEIETVFKLLRGTIDDKTHDMVPELFYSKDQGDITLVPAKE